MSIIKYRVKDVAADFGVAPKEIAEVISKFGDKPKSTSQVLEEDTLNALFDYMTATHQVASMEDVFAAQTAKKEEAAPPAPPAPSAEEVLLTEIRDLLKEQK